MNPAQQQTIVVSGAVAPLSATLQQHLVTASVNASGTLISVTATQATGNDVLHLADAAGDTADVPIRVAFNAGTIVPQLALTVTGNPIDPAWLAAQVRNAVARATQTLAGAQATIASPSPFPLATGATASVSVPVTIAGNGLYFDQSGSTSVTVTQLPLAQSPAQLLFYDDDPENVGADGVLFRATMTSGQPVRLYTYHENLGTPRSIAVVLDAATPSRVQVIDAPAGPNIDVMSVGHAVGVAYLTQAPVNEGTVISLDGQSPFALHDTAASDKELFAEALDLRVLSGGPVSVTVLSLSGSDPAAVLDEPPLPGDGHHRTGTFVLSGFGIDAASYAVGGEDASVTYGGRVPTPPNASPGAAGRDYGDYGVLHRIVFTLTNPTDSAANAYLYERPSGGPVRSSFLVDGTLLQLGCARLAVPYLIQAYGLQPHSTYQVVVETTPDGGSSYPLEVGVTTTPPASAPPPIDSPDGCFPKL